MHRNVNVCTIGEVEDWQREYMQRNERVWNSSAVLRPTAAVPSAALYSVQSTRCSRQLLCQVLHYTLHSLHGAADCCCAKCCTILCTVYTVQPTAAVPSATLNTVQNCVPTAVVPNVAR